MASRLETNFVRLLNRCEGLAAQDKLGDWRLEKYVGALQEQLQDLKKAPSKPGPEVLTEYTRKVDFLKGLLEADKMPTASSKALHAEFIHPAPPGVTSSNLPSKELHLQKKAHYQGEMRAELLGTKDKDAETDDGLRQRKPASSTEEDIDQVLQHHHQMQEKLAEEMLHFTHTIKETAERAGKIVRDDVKKIDESSRLADTNTQKLKVESERLEAHVKRSCNWGMWIMLLLVCVVFIVMVVFMRLFPKPR